jgi:Transposase IS116/IS110/IS902 family
MALCARRFHLADELQRITGVDLTRIDGVDVMVAQTVISEVGLDMSRWKTEAHFASWLGLCPDNRISGDKVLARGTRHVLNDSHPPTLELSNQQVSGEHGQLALSLVPETWRDWFADSTEVMSQVSEESRNRKRRICAFPSDCI